MPISVDKLIAIMQAADNDPELLTHDSDFKVANNEEAAYFLRERLKKLSLGLLRKMLK